MARFFIDRPIFAWVLAIVVMLAGGLSIHRLPLEQYPDIAPTRISITATYPGASAKTIEDSVTQVIEQKLKGLDRLTYMSASSTSSGTATLQLSFEAGTNPDVAQMQVQNKLQQAMSQLPQAVQAQGVSVTKAGTDLLLFVALYSTDGRLSGTEIGDVAQSTLIDALSRIDGVGDVTIRGSGHAMRLWLDPQRMNQHALMPSDIRSAVQAQNTEVSSGQIGALPAQPGQQLTATITARSRLNNAEQFRQIMLKAAPDGSVVRLGDVARVELGAENYSTRIRFNGQTAAGVNVFLASGANALDVAQAVRDRLRSLEPFLPQGVKAEVSYDTTPFVRISIEEVVKTLIEAMVLVVLVMYLFLQNLRATLIPAIAVPVVLLGTFGVLAAFGYSINTLTMFGLVLAIGLLVDDAIVVVENVERLMAEEGLSPREATRKSMDEVTGALVGIALVLSAVFLPMAFFGGSTGVIYRQFSITIVSAMLLSALVALTLSPALCASLLCAPSAHEASGHRGWLGRFFGGFNRGFDRGADGYRSAVGGLLARPWRGVLVYVLLLAGAAFLYARLPTAFLPDEDQGTLQIQVKMPPGATAERLQAVMTRIEAHLAKQPDIRFYNLVTGASGDQGTGQGFIGLRDWSLRPLPEQSAGEIARRLTADFRREVRDAQVFVLLPPAVRGLGSNAGFNLYLQDVGGLGAKALNESRDRFLESVNARSEVKQVRSNNLIETPQYQVHIDDARLGSLGLAPAAVNDTLSSAFGGSYINDFLLNGRIRKVVMQGEIGDRMSPEAIERWRVRNAQGQMVPFASFASGDWRLGSPQLTRYNGVSAIELIGDAAPGVSSGAAMEVVEQEMAKMPAGIGFEWTGKSYQERLSGSQAPLLYAVSILFVFLCLAALYESWTVPLSVILAVPLGILGAVAATSFAGLTNDVYFQVGLLATVGLAAKNAILIVEFAKSLQEQGVALVDATLQACRLRLRPILMTSLAFLFGVLPLALSSGAGSGSRRAIGVGVLGGVSAATLLGVVFVPLFFVIVRRWFSRPAPQAAEST
jgi:hydrophobe/amphiphile efflux-1 (HAE1) family protein